jgi:hypothetical protein
MKLLKAILVLTLFLNMLPITASALSIRIPVRKLAPVQDVRLRGTKDSFHFSVPIPKRWKVRSAKFHFNYTNSSALIPQTSRLVFFVHDKPLAQIRLNPDAPVGDVFVDVPGDLLKEGYNTCRLVVSQHYTIEECEDPFAPELWTWINLEKAYFVFQIDPVPIPLSVSAISDFLFDSRNIFDTSVNLVIPELTPHYVKQASLAAAGIALRYDYRPVDFILSDDIRMGCDNILIGNHPDFWAYLKVKIQDFDGPTIAIRNAPMKTEVPFSGGPVITEDPHHALVILFGNDPSQLALAVKAFASLSYPFPSSSTVRVADVQLPEIQPSMLKNGLLPGNTYSLGSLGMASVSFRGISAPAASINLRLPSDLYLSPNKFADLVLNMAYDAAMRSDSVLNIQINGKFVTGIQLDNPKGGYFKGYKISIPLSAFKPGINQLAFKAELTPLHTNKCTLIQTENLRLSIFQDSTLTLPEVPYWIKMPKLEVFFQDAFPFGKWPDMRETVVAISEKTFAAVTAAVNMVAISSQKTGYPPFNLSFQFDLNTKQLQKDVIMVGSLTTIPNNIIDHAPLAGVNPTKVKFQHLAGPNSNRSKPIDFWERFTPTTPELPKNSSDYIQATTVISHVFGKLPPGRGALMQFQHPDVMGRTIVLLTAATDADLTAGSKALWDPVVQAGCQGDLTFLNLDAVEFDTLSMLVGSSYYLGKPGAVPLINNIVNTHPLIFLFVLLLIIILLLGLTLKLIRKWRKGRIAKSNV